MVAEYISIHAPREGGDTTPPIKFARAARISIHAPREGGDPDHYDRELACRISIHAPREGGDDQLGSFMGMVADFNPRPPRGGRRSSKN